MLVLDTHVVIDALIGALSPTEEKLLSKDEWSVSAITLWEIAKLSQLKRIRIPQDDPEFAEDLKSIPAWPLTYEICRKSCELDFRADPADELIAATCIVHGLRLVTRDKAILRSKLLRFG